MNVKCPVVLVHGLLGWGDKRGPIGLPYWDTAVETQTEKHGLDVHVATVGPISSFHDRACELYAQIRGRKTDFGEKHSSKYDHLRYGREYEPFHPEWSEQNPVHLVGHSAGANTVRMLQHLLATDFWDEGTNANWVKSITGISGVYNGSLLAYLFGFDKSTGRLKEGSKLATSLFGALQQLDVLTSIGSAVRNKELNVYDWHFDQWGIDQKALYTMKDANEQIKLQEKFAKETFFGGTDNLMYDLTLQGCYGMNEVVRDYDETYYFSFVTTCFDEAGKLSMKTPLLLLPWINYQRNIKFTSPPVPSWNCKNAKEWDENDGLVSACSQDFPRYTCATKRKEPVSMASDTITCKKGRWHVAYVRDLFTKENIYCDHATIVFGRKIPNFFSMTKTQQRLFYESLFNRLSQIS